jgi:hypothetical protein
MTVPANLNRVDYTGTGSAGPFTVPFPFYDASHLTVLQTDALFNQTTLTGWTATGAGGPSGAVTLAAACPFGSTLTILRLVPLTQITSIKNQEAFFPEVHEQEMDLLAMADQQLDEAMDRTLRLPAGLSGVDMTLPRPDPGHSLVWNAGGTALENAGVASATLQQDLADSADVAKGDAMIAVKPAFTGAVARTQHDKNMEFISVKDFGAIGDYNGTTGTDNTTALQNAINAAFSAELPLFVNPGNYMHTGLYIPGRVTGSVDDRGKCFRMLGAGTGEPFAVDPTRAKGSILTCVANVPCLQNYNDNPPLVSNGTLEISYIRFVGNTTAPIIKFTGLYGISSIHHCTIYQLGNGDGLYIGFSATINIHDCYFINKDWLGSPKLYSSRTGIGVNHSPTYGAGLFTINKCTSRGWLTAYSIGNVGNYIFNPIIMASECSCTYNGIILTNTRKANIIDCYLEGQEEGVGILDKGDFTTIRDNLIFPGSYVCVQSDEAYTKGTVIDGNILAVGNVANSTVIKLRSDGYNKNVTNNTISHTYGTNGVTGIDIYGTSPNVNIMGNAFDDKAAWIGTNTVRIKHSYTGNLNGIVQSEFGDKDATTITNGSFCLFKYASALTESNVVTNNLTIPSIGNYLQITCSVATIVNRITTSKYGNRIVHLHSTNTNLTVQDGAYIQLAGGTSFTGIGILTLFIDTLGGSNYAYEISRSSL